jgi:hypothetical protein
MSIKKIKIASIKFAGLAQGGTERFLQTIMANLPKDKFEVDYYYTNAAPYVASDYKHGDNDSLRGQYLKDNGVNLIPVHVDFKDITKPHHPWLGTNLYDLFDESKYDVVASAVAGHREFPFSEILNTPIVEIVTLPGMANRQENIITTIHISEFQKNSWINVGGDPKKAIVLPIVSEMPIKTNNNLKQGLGIPQDHFVFGMHQRPDDGIFSPIGLDAYKNLTSEKVSFVIMGGSKMYGDYAKLHNIKNFYQIPASGEPEMLDKFLNTIDVFAHSRKDGETFGNCLVEAMSYSKCIISHIAPAMGHIETIGNAGFISNSIYEYTSYMVQLMNNVDGLRDKLSSNALKKYNKDYSIPKIMEQIIKIYENAAMVKLSNNMTDEEFWENM